MFRRFLILLFLLLTVSVSVHIPLVSAQPIIVRPPTPTRTLTGQLIEDTDPLDSLKINLGSAINSPYSELFPIITPDEQVLYFVRKGSPENTGYAERQDDEDIWYSLRQPNGAWGPAKKLEGPLNTVLYDGVRAINRTNTHLYLQNVYRTDGTRAKGFSVSVKGSDGTWSYPEPLDIANYYNDTNIAMMTVSNDEDYMILSLKRKDGLGKHDLYVSHNLGGVRWSEPKPIVGLNTPGDEIAPFIASDDRTLYFSTDGRGGLGSEDVYKAQRLDSTWLRWGEPQNLGKPINTASFDAYFTLTGRGDTAYFASAHQSSTRGFGKGDLWKIGLSNSQQPGSTIPSPPYVSNQLVNRLIKLDGIYFDVDRSKFKPESMHVLEQLERLMKEYPNMKIEVQGHTDNQASAEHNQILSQERALAVKQYLVDRGIAAQRIDAKGYGLTKPIASNDTPQGRQINRRVMVLVKGTGVAELDRQH